MKLITKLTVFSIIIAILPMALTYELYRRSSSREIENQNNANLQLALSGLQLELENIKEELFQKAIRFSRLPNFRKYLQHADKAQLQQFLLEIQENFGIDLLQVNNRYGVCLARLGEWTTVSPEDLPTKVPNVEDKAYFEADSEDQVVYLKSSIPIFYQEKLAGYLTVGQRINRDLMWRVSQVIHHDVFIFYNHRYLTGTTDPFNLPLDLATLSQPMPIESSLLSHFRIEDQTYNILIQPITQNGVLLGFLGTLYPISQIRERLVKRSTTLFWVYCIGLFVGLVGAFLLVKNIKDSLFGMEPDAIANLLCERTALLQSIHEGVIAVDHLKKVTFINTEAQKLFELNDEIIGQSWTRFFPKDSPINSAIKERKALYNQQLRIGKAAFLYNLVPVYHQHYYLGAIATFTDLTELHEIAEELTAVKTYTEALRAQAHEYKNKLHTISGLIQINCLDEALHLIHQTFEVQQQSLQFIMKAFPNPQISGLLIGKLNRGLELGIKMTITRDSSLDKLPPRFLISDLVCILGNLLENAFEALQGKGGEKQVGLQITERRHFLWIKVCDNGHGIPRDQYQIIFQKGYTNKSDPNHGMGLFLIRNCLTELKGTITVLSRPDRMTLFVVKIPLEDLNNAAIDRSHG
jgi:sensor histidine kinase regulating citrate/malate metabolism